MKRTTKNYWKLLNAYLSTNVRLGSAVALAQKGGRLIVVRGESPGVILTEPRGAGGFGYDPLFYDETYRQTYGEMDEETKNAISHRSRALLALREELMK